MSEVKKSNLIDMNIENDGKKYCDGVSFGVFNEFYNLFVNNK